MRIGFGYDVHRFKKGRKCVLCGVEIPSEIGPDGHSDADVPVHALMDALLGAVGQGDIGRHFPDASEEYRGISSIMLLQRVYDILCANGYAANNIDCTIVCQKPKLAAFLPEMAENIRVALHMIEGTVNVKATTEEGLGFTGSSEGIAAHAVCTVVIN